ncbi:retrotransposon protein, putative, ty1-copia subclass [Tanacetum coccineum]
MSSPYNYRAALLDPESKKWLEAMNAEMKSIKDNQVWNLVDLPPNCKTVGSKWLFKKKTDMDSNIHTYKAHLVAKGFTQTYGVDYEETFSPVADIKAIRILIAIAAYYDYEIWQMDVKTAFLNGHLNKDVYMVQPEGFVNPKHPRRVCKLQRSIYGLKQASRSWNKRFDEEIKKYGFTQNPDEPCVYKRASGSIIVFLILYVDDILLMGNNIPMLQDVKSWLGKCFAMKDLDLRKSQGPSTPAEVKRMKGIPYASVVGESYWTVVKNILKYLRNTKDMFLVYGGDSTTKLRVTCYTDASWETDQDNLRSQTGFIFMMNGGAVDWKCSKQSTTTMSSMEAKYIDVVEAAIKAIWIRKFIYGLGVVPSIDKPMDMYCDNTSAITIADEPGVQKGAKHFQRKYHFIREVIQKGNIRILKVHTDNNLVDPLTKPLPCTKHVKHARSIGLCFSLRAISIIFLCTSENLFHVAWQGNFESWVQDPLHVRPIAHAIWDPHFCQPAIEAFTQGGALRPVNVAYSGVYQWWYIIGLRTNEDLYTGALFLLFISAISLIAGLFDVSSLAWTGHLVYVAILASRGETNFGIGHSIKDLFNAHIPPGGRLGCGHKGLYDKLKNSIHFQLRLALASLGLLLLRPAGSFM